MRGVANLYMFSCGVFITVGKSWLEFVFTPTVVRKLPPSTDDLIPQSEIRRMLDGVKRISCAFQKRINLFLNCNFAPQNLFFCLMMFIRQDFFFGSFRSLSFLAADLFNLFSFFFHKAFLGAFNFIQQ